MVRPPRPTDTHHGAEISPTNLKELKSPLKTNMDDKFKSEFSPNKLLKSLKNNSEQNQQKPKSAVKPKNRPKTSKISKTQSAVPKSEVDRSKIPVPLTKSFNKPKAKTSNRKPSAPKKKLTPNQAKSEPIKDMVNLSKKIVSRESPRHIGEKYIIDTEKKIREIQKLAQLKRESLENSLARLEKEADNISNSQKQDFIDALNKLRNDNSLDSGSLPLIETFRKNERKPSAGKTYKKVNKLNSKVTTIPKKITKKPKSSTSKPPKTETLYNNPTNNKFNINEINTMQFEGSRISLTTHYQIPVTEKSSKIPIIKKKIKNKKIIKRKGGEVTKIKPKITTPQALMDSSAASFPAITTEKELVKHTDSLIISSKKLQNTTSTKRSSKTPDYIKLKTKRPISTVKAELKNPNEPKAENLKSCLKKGRIEEKTLQEYLKMEGTGELGLTPRIPIAQN